jgi:hypothetical protein
METNNNISQVLLNSSEPMSQSYDTTSGTGFFDGLKNINATTWILIILILAFLGFNIFVYLAKGTQTFTNIFAPLIDKIFGTAAVVTGKVVNVSAEGAKAVVGGTANVITTGLTDVQDVTAPLKGETIQTNAQPQGDQSTLNRALNMAQTQEQGQQDYQANEASSSVHTTAKKSGWCYIGEDRGFRTCGQVGVNDTCMSGDIFPSQEICMNPNLRA